MSPNKTSNILIWNKKKKKLEMYSTQTRYSRGNQLSSKMESSIMASGREMLDGDTEYKSGLTVRGMKVTGSVVKPMDRVYFIL